MSCFLTQNSLKTFSRQKCQLYQIQSLSQISSSLCVSSLYHLSFKLLSPFPLFFSFSNMFSAGFWQKESRFLISLREGVEEGIRQGRKGKSNFLCFNSHPHIHIQFFCQYSMNSIWSDG